ncbi:MAG: hypothetical protein IME93_03055 [Proteobacteria bacterium]|nr:hypothetical protein [Pseudomonadota bacterium]
MKEKTKLPYYMEDVPDSAIVSVMRQEMFIQKRIHDRKNDEIERWRKAYRQRHEDLMELYDLWKLTHEL